MTDINVVVVHGRLTRDIGDRDFVVTKGGTPKVRFSIATNESFKKPDGEWGEETSYFDIEAWGKQADFLRQHLAKGKLVAVAGSLKQDRWQDAQTGNNRSRVFIKAKNVQLLREGQTAARNDGLPPDDEVPFGDDYPDGVYPDKMPF